MYANVDHVANLHIILMDSRTLASRRSRLCRALDDDFHHLQQPLPESPQLLQGEGPAIGLPEGIRPRGDPVVCPELGCWALATSASPALAHPATGRKPLQQHEHAPSHDAV